MSDDRSRKRGRANDDDGYYPSHEFAGEYPPPNGNYPPQQNYNQGYQNYPGDNYHNGYQGGYQGNYQGNYPTGGYQGGYQSGYQGGYQGNNAQGGYANYPPQQLPQQGGYGQYNQYNQGPPPPVDYNQPNPGFGHNQGPAPSFNGPPVYASGSNNTPIGMSPAGPLRESYAGIGGKRGRREPMYQQSQQEFDKAVELCNNLEYLGDSPYEMKVLLLQSSETLAFCWNDKEFSSNLLKYLGAVAYELPHKSVIFSGLLLLSNAKNGDIGKDYIKWLKERIDEVFDAMVEDGSDKFTAKSEMAHSKSWNVITTLLRMIGLLSNIIEDFDEVISFTYKLIDFAIELQNSREERSGLAEMIFYQVVIGVPFYFVNDQNNEELKSKLKELIQHASKFQIKTNESEFDDDYYKPIGTDDGSCVKMSEVLAHVCDATSAYLDNMNLFMDISGLVDGLIDTVLVERGIKLAKMEAERKNAETGEKKEERETKEGEDDDYKPADEENKDAMEEDTKEKVENEDLQPEPQFVEKHSIGEIQVPTFTVLSKYEDFSKFASDVDKIWKHPRYYINTFSFEQNRQQMELETLPPMDSYVSMILNDNIVNILFKLEYNRVTGSKQLLNLQTYYNHKAFAKPNSPLDKLMIIKDLKKSVDFDLIKNLEESTDFEEDIKQQMINSAKKIQEEYEKGYTSTWKMEEIVLENIINLIFVLPESSLSLLYFESLIADTCGRNWTVSRKNMGHANNANELLIFSKLVGDIFRYMFNNIEKLEFVNINKFINWFLFQISNFKFEWAWEDWVGVIYELGEAEQNYNAKIYFIKNVIHKELLINSFKFIKNISLPRELRKYANLSLKTKEELIEYDDKFFGRQFAEKNTINPFDEEEDQNEQSGDVPDSYKNYEFYSNEAVVETNTDTFKLFDNYLFNHDEHPYNEFCRDMYMNLENVEESVETLNELINKLRERIENEAEDSKVVENSDEYIVTVLIQSMCLIGSRSFSVFEESLKKVFGEKLKFVLDGIDNDLKEEWIIDAVLRIWNNEPRIGLLFIDKLNKFGVIETHTIIKKVWNLSTDRLLPLSELYVGEFLETLIEDELYGDEEEEEDEAKDVEDGGEGEKVETAGEEVDLEWESKIGDSSREKHNEALKYNLEIAIEKMNELYNAVENGLELQALKSLTATDEDYKWAVKDMHGLLKHYIFKYGADLGVQELEEVLSGLDNDEIREELTRMSSQLV